MQGDVEASEENIEVFPRVLTDEEKLLAGREYLLRVSEIPESVLIGWYAELVAYFQDLLR